MFLVHSFVLAFVVNAFEDIANFSPCNQACGLKSFVWECCQFLRCSLFLLVFHGHMNASERMPPGSILM